jgi:hypothetical protein
LELDGWRLALVDLSLNGLMELTSRIEDLARTSGSAVGDCRFSERENDLGLNVEQSVLVREFS